MASGIRFLDAEQTAQRAEALKRPDGSPAGELAVVSDPEQGHPVWAGERRLGVVTSGTQSPTLGVPIAMAYVAPDAVEPGTVVDVEIREARVPARITSLPFYRRAV